MLSIHDARTFFLGRPWYDGNMMAHSQSVASSSSSSRIDWLVQEGLMIGVASVGSDIFSLSKDIIKKGIGVCGIKKDWEYDLTVGKIVLVQTRGLCYLNYLSIRWCRYIERGEHS